MRLAFAVGRLQQHVIGRSLGKRVALVREMMQDEVDAQIRDQLEGSQRRAQHRLRQFEQTQCCVRIPYRGHRRDLCRRQRIELERRGGDHAERALGADEEIAQVVTGVVLAQPAQAVPDLAFGGDHLETEAQFARIAVAQHGGAAGIGRQIAPDGAGAFRREAERIEPAGRVCRLVHPGERDARVDRDRIVDRVECAHPGEPGQREHHRTARCVRGRTARQAGVAALWNDGHPVARAPAHHGGDVLDRVGLGDGDCTPEIAPAPVGGERFDVGRISDQPAAKAVAQRVGIDRWQRLFTARGTRRRACVHRSPGIRPFMPRIIFASPPFCIFFIIDCI